MCCVMYGVGLLMWFMVVVLLLCGICKIHLILLWLGLKVFCEPKDSTCVELIIYVSFCMNCLKPQVPACTLKLSCYYLYYVPLGVCKTVGEGGGVRKCVGGIN